MSVVRRSARATSAGSDRCLWCGQSFSSKPNSPQRRSWDHILPAARGGRNSRWPGAPTNLRLMCQACNDLRAACGHCVGAMACVRDVAERTLQAPPRTARLWAMPYWASLCP